MHDLALREGEQFANAYFSTETKIKMDVQDGLKPSVILADITLSIVRRCFLNLVVTILNLRIQLPAR